MSRCSCQAGCGTFRCSCKKRGVPCSIYCECNADDCENREELLPEENLTDTEDSNSTGTYSETEVADHTENIYYIPIGI